MQGAETRTFSGEAERRRVQAVVETLARTRQPGYTAAEVAHDARNMVTALELYCDLLAEPGVLTEGSLHYASELKLVASASRRLVEKLMLLDGRESTVANEPHELARRQQALACPNGEYAGRGSSGRSHTRPGAGDRGQPEPAGRHGRHGDYGQSSDGGRRASGSPDRGRPDPGSGEPGEERHRGHAPVRTDRHHPCGNTRRARRAGQYWC